MVKCYRHIEASSDEWCWKCQELTDNERIKSNKTIIYDNKRKIFRFY